MFLMGMELDRGLLKRNWKLSLPIAISAIVIPVGLGVACAFNWLYEVNNEGTNSDPPKTGFILFVGASMSFTAFPVLASILNANNLFASPLGVLVRHVCGGGRAGGGGGDAVMMEMERVWRAIQGQYDSQYNSQCWL